jgi:peptidyl-prolyl cis-trans isomerase NIMA-interacting 1
MRTVLLLVWLPCAAACADLTEPSGQPRPERIATPAEATASAAATGTATAAPPGTAAAPSERVTASHILVAYQGATRSTATRSKDEAKKRADQLLARARKSDDFAGLARENSDDPTAKARGGDLGAFSRQSMVKPFSDAAFALKPGEVSSVVETEFGFHIIKRTL